MANLLGITINWGLPNSGGDLNTLFTSAVSIVSTLAMFVAVCAIVYGGVLYMTSAGDAGKVKQAKNTILYAIIGLLVSALAFAIVSFVLRGMEVV